jgi:hypothetical protein
VAIFDSKMAQKGPKPPQNRIESLKFCRRD